MKQSKNQSANVFQQHFFTILFLKVQPDIFCIFWKIGLDLHDIEFCAIESCLAAAKNVAFNSVPQYYSATTWNQLKQAGMAAHKFAGF